MLLLQEPEFFFFPLSSRIRETRSFPFSVLPFLRAARQINVPANCAGAWVEKREMKLGHGGEKKTKHRGGRRKKIKKNGTDAQSATPHPARALSSRFPSTPPPTRRSKSMIEAQTRDSPVSNKGARRGKEGWEQRREKKKISVSSQLQRGTRRSLRHKK